MSALLNDLPSQDSQDFEIRPLPAPLGAEVLGLDLSQLNILRKSATHYL